MDALTTFIVVAVGLTLALLVIAILLLALSAILTPVIWFLQAVNKVLDWSMEKLGAIPNRVPCDTDTSTSSAVAKQFQGHSQSKSNQEW